MYPFGVSRKDLDSLIFLGKRVGKWEGEAELHPSFLKITLVLIFPISLLFCFMRILVIWYFLCLKKKNPLISSGTLGLCYNNAFSFKANDGICSISPNKWQRWWHFLSIPTTLHKSSCLRVLKTHNLVFLHTLGLAYIWILKVKFKTVFLLSFHCVCRVGSAEGSQPHGSPFWS